MTIKQVAVASLLLGLVLAGTLTSQGPSLAMFRDSHEPEGRAIAEQGDEKDKLLATCIRQSYRFTPIVRRAYLAYAKAAARADLTRMGKAIPGTFLAWIDSDPEMEAGVYGARNRAAGIILMLYSLRMDMGEEDFRRYRQLALATAVVYEDQGAEADISERAPLQLSIGGDPRRPVDTRDKSRKLDRSDHIINFLNSRKIEGKPLTMRGEKAKEPVPTERTLIAADVIASASLQAEFNKYMADKGFPVNIDCGDQVVHLKSKAAVKGERRTKIRTAFELFKEAYEAKGLLPKERDPAPTPGEICVYLVRNDKYRLKHPPEKKSKAFYFPLTAPWPTMTLLVANRQSLREREERWQAYRDRGIFVTYGEYIGGIAQQFDMQSARRLSPHPFTYGTVQMMLKDGGVCGHMANISVRSRISVGIPACTAGQPGHCALIFFYHDPKSQKYDCLGGQYVTGGHEKTTPHGAFYFGNPQKQTTKKRGKTRVQYPRHPMVYHRSVSWAVNHGMASFMDSTMAFHLYHLLPETQRQEKGRRLLVDGLRINPFNIILVESAQGAAQTADQLLQVQEDFAAILAAETKKSGTRVEALYTDFFKTRMFRKLAEMPVPSSSVKRRKIRAYLEKENRTFPAATLRYRVAAGGVDAVAARTRKEFRTQLKSFSDSSLAENEKAAEEMSMLIKATVGILEKKDRQPWALSMWSLAAQQPHYFGNRQRLQTHPAWNYLRTVARQKKPGDLEVLAPAMKRVAAELAQSLRGKRQEAQCRALAGRITSVAQAIKDEPARRQWLQSMQSLMKGREILEGKDRSKKRRDPCSTAINKLIAAMG
jgi:hypothetical protein